MHICAIVHTFQYIVQCILLLYHELVQMMAHTYEKQGLMTRYSNKFAKNHRISFIFRLRNRVRVRFLQGQAQGASSRATTLQGPLPAMSASLP